MSLQPGIKLGLYEILTPLGAGGMGEVWKARDPKLDRLVAIKVLPKHLAVDADALARFEREAKALAALQHPNVLGIFDFGTEDGIAYAVMELLEGRRCATFWLPAPRSRGRRWTSPSRSPMASLPPTERGSSTGISNPRTSSSRRTAE